MKLSNDLIVPVQKSNRSELKFFMPSEVLSPYYFKKFKIDNNWKVQVFDGAAFNRLQALFDAHLDQFFRYRLDRIFAWAFAYS